MIMSLSAESCSGPPLDSVEESPLEVLSRAATMLRQESQQSALADESKRHQQKQTTKWKRDRRRLPEYSRKSDPKIPETLGADPSSPEASISNSGSPLGDQLKNDQDQFTHIIDRPLDMTVKQRGHPPSYDQTMSNPDYRLSLRSNSMQNGIPPIVFNTEELPSGISMCDPVIEEHFRRSLGRDYHTLFRSNNSSEGKEPLPTPSQKVALIMGIMGACRSNELYGMKITHLQDFDQLFWLTCQIPRQKFTENLLLQITFAKYARHIIAQAKSNSLQPTTALVKKAAKVASQWKNWDETSNITEFMDDTGLSVDDHFAKALGDTWKQLNRKGEIKNREHESTLLSAKN